MAEEVTSGKRIKISKAQQNMLVAVGTASVVLGICLVLSVYFLKYIRFNIAVIEAKDEAIEGYSGAIENIGVCKKPRGATYSNSELNSCSPNDVSVDDVVGSLRYGVMVDMARNQDLESVARGGLTVCLDASTGEKMSYDKLYEKYENATTDEDKVKYLEIFGMCSALRAIPDALPASNNPLALMASLDKIFRLSGWMPESLAPGSDIESGVEGLGAIGLNLSMQTNTTTAYKVLRNIEKSIRDVELVSASLEFSNGALNLNGSAMAFYTQKAGLVEGLVTVNGEGLVTKTVSEEEE